MERMCHKKPVTCLDLILIIPKSYASRKSKLFIAVLHTISFEFLSMCAKSLMSVQTRQEGLSLVWPKGSSPAIPPLCFSIWPFFFISSSMALLRGGQVVLTLKKQYPCREQPAQTWPPSLVLSFSFLFFWPQNWKAGRLLSPVWTSKLYHLYVTEKHK